MAPSSVPTGCGARTGAGALVPGGCTRLPGEEADQEAEGGAAKGESCHTHPGGGPRRPSKKEVCCDEKCGRPSAAVDTLVSGVHPPGSRVCREKRWVQLVPFIHWTIPIQHFAHIDTTSVLGSLSVLS